MSTIYLTPLFPHLAKVGICPPSQWRIQKSLVGDVVEWPEPEVKQAFQIQDREAGCGVWVVGGVSPSPRGKGCAPSPEIFFHFGPQNGQFRCIVGAIFLQFVCLCNTQKRLCSGLKHNVINYQTTLFHDWQCDMINASVSSTKRLTVREKFT